MLGKPYYQTKQCKYNVTPNGISPLTKTYPYILPELPKFQYEKLIPDDTKKDLTCLITEEIYAYHIIVSNGNINERHAITTWFNCDNKSLLTNIILTNKTFLSNI